MSRPVSSRSAPRGLILVPHSDCTFTALPSTSEIFPGHREAVQPATQVAKAYGFVELKRLETGHLGAFLRIFPQEISLSEGEGGVALGSPGVPWPYIYRLRKAGFVSGAALTPTKMTLDVASWFAHKAAAAAPGFWTTARKAAWRETNTSGGIKRACMDGASPPPGPVAAPALDWQSPYVTAVPCLVLPGSGELYKVRVRPYRPVPGLWEPVDALPETVIPKVAGMVTVKMVDGQLRQTTRFFGPEICLGEGEGGAALGSPGVSYQTIRRLRLAGFVKGSSITPTRTAVDVTSWFSHRAASRHPDFWTPERRKRFRGTGYDYQTD